MSMPLCIFRIERLSTLKQIQKVGVVCYCVLLLILLNVSSVSANDSLNNEELKKRLFNDLANAETEQAGRSAESALWQFWFDQSPTDEVRAALDAGMARREAYDFEAAEIHLNHVIEASPLYAEGYNQRAFVRFLRENYDGSRDDLEKALELEPVHFGAMSGLYHILRIDSRHKAALSLLQTAVGIHPWLKERHALPEDMWPDSYRDVHEKGIKM